jgi:hypothetical protein
LSEAVADTTVEVPETGALLAGAEILTVGDVVSAAPATVKLKELVCTVAPPVPDTTIVDVPIGVDPAAVIVMVVVQVGEQVVGVKEALAPAGKPDAEYDTA